MLIHPVNSDLRKNGHVDSPCQQLLVILLAASDRPLILLVLVSYKDSDGSGDDVDDNHLDIRVTVVMTLMTTVRDSGDSDDDVDDNR
ncbi:hypothetical protein RRG08_011178 [Elysia crispata]|uniref:Uncharacterized protein n=1 Tax=Elysia crispata TaxID=231223 RepID=A0AAE0Z1P2_9GAST|nr:hypothetical protein RRG08_011178 [Elysia crispata]